MTNEGLDDIVRKAVITRTSQTILSEISQDYNYMCITRNSVRNHKRYLTGVRENSKANQIYCD